MQFNFMSSEVDGTLDNPMVVAAVTIWTLILSAFSSFAVRRWDRERNTPVLPTGNKQGLRLALLVLFAFVATPFAQSAIGNMLYQVESMFDGGPRVTSVGFWGGPPILPAWIVATICGYWAFRKRIHIQ